MKRTLIGIAVAILLVAGLVAAVVLRPVEDGSPNTSTNGTSQPGTDTEEVLRAGRYEPYDAQLVSAAGYDETILFFHASWCPECRAFEQEITSADLPEGVQILKVDYDNSDDLKRTHGVTLQSTFVKVSDDGSQVSKWVGYGKDKSVDAILKNT
jgi:hypothetical protein